MKNTKKKKSRVQRLTELGIDEGALNQYIDIFLRNSQRYRHISLTGKGWKTCPYPCDDYAIIRHLQGEYTLGIYLNEEIDCLIIDIDNHGLFSESPQQRAKIVIDAFDSDFIAFQSSFSEGIHIYFFLDQTYPRKAVREYATRTIKSAGLEIRPGFIEIKADNTAIRLPLSEGSYLLDPLTLEPQHNLSTAKAIEYCKNIFSGERLKISGPQAIKTGDRKLTFQETIDRLEQEGLYPEISTYDAIRQLSWYLQARCGYTKPQTQRHLESWIHQHHNGLSRRYNTDRIDEIYTQIKYLVQAFDKTKIKHISKSKAPRVPLPLSTAKFIIGNFDGYRLQLALFSLFEYVLRFGNLSILEDEEEKEHIHILSTNYSVSSFQQWKCDIPQVSFKRMAGFNSRYPQETREIFEDKGLLILKRNAHPSTHQSKAYWVFIPESEDDGKTVISIDEAILLLKDEKAIQNSYTRYRADKILKLDKGVIL